MKSFVISRKTDDELDQAVKMRDWCNIQFGESRYTEWYLEFAFIDNDDYVRFAFLKEECATLFKLRWGQYILNEYND